MDQEGNIYVALAYSFNTINIYDPSGQLINTLHRQDANISMGLSARRERFSVRPFFEG